MRGRKIFLYRGYHSVALYELLKVAWEANNLVLLLPPQVNDFTFLSCFKNELSEVFSVGDWPVDLQQRLDAFLKLPNSAQVEGAQILDNAILAVFTSGTTTGVPRLIFYSKENVLASLSAIRKLFDVSRLKNIFVYPQPTHCFGLILGYMQAVIFNLKISFYEGTYSRLTHEKWRQSIDDSTLTLGAPAHFLDLLDYVSGKVNMKKSYSAIVGGALVTKKLWHQLKNDLKIEQPSIGYGGTEASPGLTHLPPSIEPEQDGDIGYPLQGVTISSTPQHVEFRGANSCLASYQNGKITTTEPMILNDLLTSKIEASGKTRFHFICRSDLLVNRGGQKISLEAVAAGVTNNFNCKSLAIAFFDPRLQEDIAIIIEPKVDQDRIDLVKLQQQILDECGFKIPKSNIIFAPIPLNANNKFDRTEALKIFLRTRALKFPIPVAYVKAFLPHSGSAVWVDTLVKTEKNFSLTQTELKKNGVYFVNGRLAESSLIEFMAQSYGYMLALNDILNIQPVKAATVTLVAEIKDSKFNFKDFDILPQVGDFLEVEATGTHDFGNLKLVKGNILFKGKILASLNMKLYCS